MGEFLLGTTLIILVAVLYYVKKNKPLDKKRINPNSTYTFNYQKNEMIRNPNSNFSNYGNNSYSITTPHRTLLREDLNYQNHNDNPMTPLRNYFNNSKNLNNAEQASPISVQFFNNNFKIINHCNTPIRDDIFLNTKSENPNMDEFTSAISKPELFINNHRKSLDEDDLPNSNFTKKRRSKYSDNSLNEIDIKDLNIIDLSKNPATGYFQETLTILKKNLMNSKYFKVIFYKNLLFFFIQFFLELSKGGIELIENYFNKKLNSQTQVYYLNMKKNITDDIQSDSANNQFNNNRIRRNLDEADFKINDSNPNQNYKNKMRTDLTRNMIPIYNEKADDLNEYIKNNNEKKLKLRDIVFSDNNTHENYAPNSIFLNNNNFEEKNMNFPNSVRQNRFDKIVLNDNNFNQVSKAKQFSNDRPIFTENEINKAYPLFLKNGIVYDYDLKNSTKITPNIRILNKISNQSLQNEEIIYKKGKNNPKNELIDSKTPSNLFKNKNELCDDFQENFRRENLFYNQRSFSPIAECDNAYVVEKRSSSVKKEFISHIENENTKLLEQNINFNSKNVENQFKNLDSNASPDLRLLREFTPRAENKNINNISTKINMKINYDNSHNNLVYSREQNIYNSRSQSKISNQTAIKKPSVRFNENEKDFNTLNIYCNQTGNMINKKFSELPIQENNLITQAKVCQNSLIESTNLNLVKDIPNFNTNNRIRSVLFNKTESCNQNLENYDLNKILNVTNHNEMKNEISNYDKILPSQLNTERSKRKINPVEQLPSSIKKTDEINSNIFLSSGNKLSPNNQKESLTNSLEKAIILNEIEENPQKFTNSSNNQNNSKNRNINHSKSKKEASNFRKMSNKKMTFAPSDFQDFFDLESNKSKENKIISLIPEESESDCTKINAIQQTRINIKNVNIEYTKE